MEFADCSFTCSSPGCTNPATLACPTCLKLGLPPSRFCNQDCFKSSWSVHKDVHKSAKQAVSATNVVSDPSILPREFAGYEFTGSLRPYQVTPQVTVDGSIRKPDYATHMSGVSVSEQNDKRTNGSVRVYSPDEVQKIRESCRIGREILDEAAAAIRPGITCDEIDRIVHQATISRNAYPSPLNYYNFPKSVCTSVNEVICHGIPDLRPLQDGDIVNVDVSAYYNGFHSDLNETFMVGSVDNDSRRLVECAYKSLAAAVAMVRPGTLYRDLGDTIERVAKSFGCSVVRTYCGHGVGDLFHTMPNIPHYGKNKAKGLMAVGHVFTIEPMINLGSYRDVTWPDKWTAVTVDGKRSSQFEHTMIVTETGVELLTARPGEPTDRMEWDPSKFQK